MAFPKRAPATVLIGLGAKDKYSVDWSLRERGVLPRTTPRPVQDLGRRATPRAERESRTFKMATEPQGREASPVPSSVASSSCICFGSSLVCFPPVSPRWIQTLSMLSRLPFPIDVTDIRKKHLRAKRIYRPLPAARSLGDISDMP